MVKSTILLLLTFSLVLSCSIKSKLLENKKTKVPSEVNYFTNHFRQKYDVELLKKIEENSIYVEIFHKDINGNKFYSSNGNYSAYKFYQNGCVNVFHLTEDDVLVDIFFDPKIRGNRGVTYNKKNKQIISLAEQINDSGTFGTRDYEMKVEGDTLFINLDIYTTYVLIKTKLPKENLNYKATW